MSRNLILALPLLVLSFGCISHKEHVAQPPTAVIPPPLVAQPLALSKAEGAPAVTSSLPSEAPFYPPLSGILDGATFVGQIEPPESAVTLSFRQGYLHVLTSEKGLFAPYMALTGDTGTAFMSISDASNNTRIRWKGVISGTNLEGTMTIFEKDKPPVEKMIIATLKLPESNP